LDLVSAVWAFILAVTAYDLYFAWSYRRVFEDWELNPLAYYLGQRYGIGAALGFRLLVIIFGAGLAAYCHHTHQRLAVRYTLFVGGVHLVLSVHYLVHMRLG
jgi:hypothetical protein